MKILVTDKINILKSKLGKDDWLSIVWYDTHKEWWVTNCHQDGRSLRIEGIDKDLDKALDKAL